MSRKSSVIVCTLVLSLAGIASAAKSYSFCLASPAKAGSTELKAGDYDVKVTGEQAVITAEASGKSISVAVTVQHNDKKFASTLVETANKDGKDYIQAIDLEGSNTRLVLNQ
jgi:hypothetical protein